MQLHQSSVLHAVAFNPALLPIKRTAKPLDLRRFIDEPSMLQAPARCRAISHGLNQGFLTNRSRSIFAPRNGKMATIIGTSIGGAGCRCSAGTPANAESRGRRPCRSSPPGRGQKLAPAPEPHRRQGPRGPVDGAGDADEGTRPLRRSDPARSLDYRPCERPRQHRWPTGFP